MVDLWKLTWEIRVGRDLTLQKPCWNIFKGNAVDVLTMFDI